MPHRANLELPRGCAEERRTRTGVLYGRDAGIGNKDHSGKEGTRPVEYTLVFSCCIPCAAVVAGHDSSCRQPPITGPRPSTEQQAAISSFSSETQVHASISYKQRTRAL